MAPHPLINEALMSYVFIFAFILGIAGTSQYQRFLKYLQTGARLSISRSGFISPYYSLGVEIFKDETTSDDFLIYAIKKHFGMSTASAKLARQLCHTQLGYLATGVPEASR